MAKSEKTAPDAATAKTGLNAWLLIAAVSLIAGAGGFAVPIVVLHELNLPDAKDAHNAKRPQQHKRGGQTPARRESSKLAKAPYDARENQPAFVPFGDVVVNLAEEKLTRYLRVTLTLQVDPAHAEVVRQVLDSQRTILKNWLIGYLSDKQVDEVRGAIGVNKARREIQEQFNRLLFPEGSDLIQDILFEEFNVT
jgi:flagellar basal body-associated protein FliL